MKVVVLWAALFCGSCTAWRGTKGDESSDWTWVCGGGDDSTAMRAPDAGCPPMDAGSGGDDVDGGA